MLCFELDSLVVVEDVVEEKQTCHVSSDNPHGWSIAYGIRTGVGVRHGVYVVWHVAYPRRESNDTPHGWSIAYGIRIGARAMPQCVRGAVGGIST